MRLGGMHVEPSAKCEVDEESGFSILQHRIAMADDALMKEDVSSVDEVAFVSLVGLCRGHRIPSVLR